MSTSQIFKHLTIEENGLKKGFSEFGIYTEISQLLRISMETNQSQAKPRDGFWFAVICVLPLGRMVIRTPFLKFYLNVLLNVILQFLEGHHIFPFDFE